MALSVDTQITKVIADDCPPYASINMFVGKADIGEVANKMHRQGYDLTFIVQQADNMLLTMLFKRRNA
jgi:hypothetical protein